MKGRDICLYRQTYAPKYIRSGSCALGRIMTGVATVLLPDILSLEMSLDMQSAVALQPVGIDAASVALNTSSHVKATCEPDKLPKSEQTSLYLRVQRSSRALPCSSDRAAGRCR